MSNLKQFLYSKWLTRNLLEYRHYVRLKHGIYSPFTKENKKNIQLLKNSKAGKRCFIIGNGPSLTIEDLEKIKNEDSFAVNRIYKIFDKTSWRPTFYCSQDTKVLEEIILDIDKLFDCTEKVFLNGSVDTSKYYKKSNLINLFLITFDYENELPKFSFNVKRGVYEGFTVAYECIQLAVYMGYSEIYLIGTDHNYSETVRLDGSIEKNENVVNYMPGLEGKTWFLPKLDKTTLAYKKAKEVCDKKGIVIKNATRGGKLEVFERIEFDNLFGA